MQSLLTKGSSSSTQLEYTDMCYQSILSFEECRQKFRFLLQQLTMHNSGNSSGHGHGYHKGGHRGMNVPNHIEYHQKTSGGPLKTKRPTTSFFPTPIQTSYREDNRFHTSNSQERMGRTSNSQERVVPPFPKHYQPKKAAPPPFARSRSFHC